MMMPKGGCYGTTYTRIFTRDALTVAQELLGKVLVHRLEGQTLAGRIVEAEAYQGPEDRAAHPTLGGARPDRGDASAPGALPMYTSSMACTAV